MKENKKDLLLFSGIIIVIGTILFFEIMSCISAITINVLLLTFITFGIVTIIILASILFVATWNDLFK